MRAIWWKDSHGLTVSRGRMPQDMPPLSDEEIETIRNWVLARLIPADFAGHDEDDDHDAEHDHEDDHDDDSGHDHG